MTADGARTIYRGTKLDLALIPLTLADGTVATREVVVHRGAVALLPMVDDDHVCLLWNHRYSVGKTLLEIPAGTLEPGEPTDVTASRELEEETGYTARRITKLRSWWVSPGVMSEEMHLYLCQDLVPGPTSHQPDEELKPIVVSWAEAVDMAMDGRIEDAKTIVSILYYDRLRTTSAG